MASVHSTTRSRNSGRHRVPRSGCGEAIAQRLRGPKAGLSTAGGGGRRRGSFTWAGTVVKHTSLSLCFQVRTGEEAGEEAEGA